LIKGARLPLAATRGLNTVEVNELIEGVLERRPRAVARAISHVETRGAGRRQLIGKLYPRTGRARIVGVTGPPGAGKSTLTDRLARLLRGAGETVGILAVDPTSPFTGGAILGDRIRMQTLYTDPGVFIRSMATRGAMGGLAPATHDAIDILDAAGFDWILLETVGVGQDEVDVVRSVPTVVLVTLPGLGDDIQAIKAGIMEIADVFVVNKADRDGVERAQLDLEMMVALADDPPWRPKVLKTVAIRGEGVEELLGEIETHQKWLEESGEIGNRRRRQLRLRVENVLKEKILERADATVGLDKEIDRAVQNGTDPYSVADGLYEGVIGAEREG